ncbi:hypothetical protein A3D78_05875 [Candidatus Gottesmanbacteria bacterium RIFCSPHIGHO2_02_FULL_39_14]|uniref:Uncharacterized protein n=1 Tax=Candidatus Gottesmanbacteria bacterium RIFCSPHIGHO2_02_FULL_39_14 TaxID=1798383 RepID=A0A1F6A0N7_9BACT|nr:MAG: hypothetical protein A3D78_05875 [Candidatus Gottesmanbacteria bacterium RIFCSPHIGHO2_02_FULL_39_14]
MRAEVIATIHVPFEPPLTLWEAPPIRMYAADLIHSNPDYRPLDLTGLPSIKVMEASLKELRGYFFGHLAENFNIQYPYRVDSARYTIYDDDSQLIPWAFQYFTNYPHGYYEWCFENFEAFARDMLFMDKVIWQGTRPLIPVELVDIYAGEGMLYFDPERKQFEFPDHTLVKHQYPIHIHEEKGRLYYDFDDPNFYYYSLIINYPFGNLNSLTQMSEEGLLKQDLLQKTLPVISFMAEYVLQYKQTSEKEKEESYLKYIDRIAELIGGEEGFAAAAAVVYDHWEVYQPFFKNGIPGSNIREPDKIFLIALNNLKKKYQIWRYENRPGAIPVEVRQKAMSMMRLYDDPIKGLYAFLEEIFSGIGATGAFSGIYGDKRFRSIRTHLERALKEKKMEAGLVPVTADIVGYDDLETLAWIAALTQGLWNAVLGLDDTIDQSQARGNEAAFHKRMGIPAGIRQPLLAMTGSIREITERKNINNNLLTNSVVTMLDELYRGDEDNSNIRWKNDFADLEKNMRRISQVLAWFPKYAVKVNEMAEATGIALAKFLENFGILMLINNDFDDLENSTHEAGSDFGNRINTFMHGFNLSPEIPQKDRDEFRAICDDPDINSKKRRFIALDEADKKKIARALELGRQYRREVVRSLAVHLKKYYDQANRALNKSAKKLPSRKHRLDGRNQSNFQVLKDSLDGIWHKLQAYALE